MVLSDEEKKARHTMAVRKWCAKNRDHLREYGRQYSQRPEQQARKRVYRVRYFDKQVMKRVAELQAAAAAAADNSVPDDTVLQLCLAN